MRWGGGRESENVEDRRSGGGMGRGIAGGAFAQCDTFKARSL